MFYITEVYDRGFRVEAIPHEHTDDTIVIEFDDAPRFESKASRAARHFEGTQYEVKTFQLNYEEARLDLFVSGHLTDMKWHAIRQDRSFFKEDLQGSQDEVVSQIEQTILLNDRQADYYEVEAASDQIDVWYKDRIIATYMPLD